MYIVGDDIVTVNTTGQDELTVAIEIDDSLTNIKRTQHYAT
jgi:DNA-binding protein YbaB